MNYVYIPIYKTSYQHFMGRHKFFRRQLLNYNITYVIGLYAWQIIKDNILINSQMTMLSNDHAEVKNNDYRFLIINVPNTYYSEGIGAKRRTILHDAYVLNLDYCTGIDYNVGVCVKWTICKSPKDKTHANYVTYSDTINYNVEYLNDHSDVGMIGIDKVHAGMGVGCLTPSLSLHKFYTYNVKLLKQLDVNYDYKNRFFGEDLSFYWKLAKMNIIMIRNSYFSLDDIRETGKNMAVKIHSGYAVCHELVKNMKIDKFNKHCDNMIYFSEDEYSLDTVPVRINEVKPILDFNPLIYIDMMLQNKDYINTKLHVETYGELKIKRNEKINYFSYCNKYIEFPEYLEFHYRYSNGDEVMNHLGSSKFNNLNIKYVVDYYDTKGGTRAKPYIDRQLIYDTKPNPNIISFMLADADRPADKEFLEDINVLVPINNTYPEEYLTKPLKPAVGSHITDLRGPIKIKVTNDEFVNTYIDDNSENIKYSLRWIIACWLAKVKLYRTVQTLMPEEVYILQQLMKVYPELQ